MNEQAKGIILQQIKSLGVQVLEMAGQALIKTANELKEKAQLPRT